MEFWIVINKMTPSSQGLVEKCSELALQRNLSPKVLCFEDDRFENQAAVRDELLARYIQLPPEAIVFERSHFFADVAPAFAAIIGKGITADCTELEWSDEHGLLQIRPTYGGRKIAVNRSVSTPYIATVRQGVFGKRGLGLNDSALETLETARLVFSGGLGLRTKENFEKLSMLAKVCGAKLGASRAAVAAGFADYNHQVGQTGVSVRPEVYVAFGISGAVQHLSGILGSEKIIAVNTDPKAAIFDYADYSLIADAEEVITTLLGNI